jgi:hypothetical protein
VGDLRQADPAGLALPPAADKRPGDVSRAYRVQPAAEDRVKAAPRTGCAARPIYHDRQLCVDRWWIVTAPTGETYELCSGACLVEFSVLGALPADLEAAQPEWEHAA